MKHLKCSACKKVIHIKELPEAWFESKPYHSECLIKHKNRMDYLSFLKKVKSNFSKRKDGFVDELYLKQEKERCEAFKRAKEGIVE